MVFFFWRPKEPEETPIAVIICIHPPPTQDASGKSGLGSGFPILKMFQVITPVVASQQQSWVGENGVNQSNEQRQETSCEMLRPIIDNGQQSMLSAADLEMERAAQDCFLARHKKA